MNDVELYEEMIRLARAGASHALATVVASSGSSPRKPGAKMLVRDDGSILGTIGGGRVEAETIQAALAAILDGIPVLLPFVLTEEHHFVCGGSLDIYVEPHQTAPQLVIFGAGHVGSAVAGLAKECGFHVTVVDERSGITSREQLPGADRICCSPLNEAFAALEITSGTSIIIATPGHELDFQAVRGALSTRAGFIGLLGSTRKRGVLMHSLEQEGVSAEERKRIICPAGLPIGSETPAEIAVSIVGQLVRHRRCGAD